MEEEPEHFERIPWTALREEARAARPWATYAVIGAIILAALVFAFTRGGAVAPTVTLPPQEPQADAPVVTPLPLPQESVLPPELYSEADLMAAAPQQDREEAAARAEWFVRDFFTTSAEGSSDGQSRHLPPGAESPEGGFSYVEWARTIHVADGPEGALEALVVFEALGLEGDGYRILPVRAVRVLLTRTTEGGLAIADLPVPAPVPFQVAEMSLRTPAEAPAETLEQGSEMAAMWGGEARLLSSSVLQGRWRLVFAVQDEVGNRWPVAVWVEGPGA